MKIKSSAQIIPGLSLLFALAATLMNVATAEPVRAGVAAPDFTLKTLDAKAVTLSAETGKHPVVLVVLRGWPGYQCPLCTRQVHEFVDEAGAFAGKARVIMIYPGPAENLQAHAQEFLKDKQWPTDYLFVTDPDFSVIKAYGLRWDAPGETAYPATFVIDTQGVIQFAKISKSHGGRAATAEVLAALEKLK